MQCAVGSKVYARPDGECIVVERKPFKIISALLWVKRVSDGAHFWVEEAAVLPSAIAPFDDAATESLK